MVFSKHEKRIYIPFRSGCTPTSVEALDHISTSGVHSMLDIVNLLAVCLTLRDKYNMMRTNSTINKTYEEMRKGKRQPKQTIYLIVMGNEYKIYRDLFHIQRDWHPPNSLPTIVHVT